MSDLREARRRVEKWLAQWGIHNDGEIGFLLDAMERAAARMDWCAHRDEQRLYTSTDGPWFRVTCDSCDMVAYVPTVPRILA